MMSNISRFNVFLGQQALARQTLAREVFRKQQSQFDCVAFIYVGGNPSIDATLMDIARQVMPMSLFPRDDEKQVTTKLWEFLGTKRYVLHPFSQMNLILLPKLYLLPYHSIFNTEYRLMVHTIVLGL